MGEFNKWDEVRRNLDPRFNLTMFIGPQVRVLRGFFFVLKFNLTYLTYNTHIPYRALDDILRRFKLDSLVFPFMSTKTIYRHKNGTSKFVKEI